MTPEHFFAIYISYIAQDDLEHVILLPLFPEYCNYRCGGPYLVCFEVLGHQIQDFVYAR